MKQQKEGLLIGSFIADALSLGAHWVYDTEKIKKDIVDLRVFHDPLSIYHPEKKAGDFTHYGDLSLFLLNFIKDYDFSKDTFEKDLSDSWHEFMLGYKGYLDHSNRESLENYKKHLIPSGQNTVSDLSPSARIAPFIYKFSNDTNKLKSYCQIQTIMTNNTTLCTQTTQMAIDVILDILNGDCPKTAIKNTLQNPNLNKIHKYIEPVFENLEKDDKQAIADFGATCTIDSALTSALFFAIKYQDDFEKALLSNIACGGDSASRGMLIGMILGAYLGVSNIPKDWINSTKHIQEVKSFF